MTKKKSIKSQIIIFLSIVILVMLFVVVFQKHAFEDINEKNSKVKNEMVAAIDTPNEKVSQDSEPMSEEKRLQYENTIAQLKSQINELQPTMETDQNSVSKFPSKPSESVLNIEYETKRIRSKYRPLFEDLELTSKDAQLLSDIFLDQIIEGNNVVNRLLTLGPGDEDEIDSINLKEIPSICKRFEDEIKDILGETNYEKYKLYEDTYKDRAMLDTFNSLLDDTDSLSKEQIYDLTEAFYSIREKYYVKYKYNLGNISGISDEESRSKAIYKTLEPMEKIERMGEEYLEKAEDLFSKEQYETFKIYYKMNGIFIGD